MRVFLIWVLTMLGAMAAQAEGEKAGDFDYFVLALSWSPNWCALEGRAKGAEQCDRAVGWNVHGLWPQNERGWPSYCRTSVRPPSRAMTRGMSDLMGSGGAAWHQWKKHGSCAGLAARDYFDLVRRAYDRVTRPAVFRKLDKRVKLPASVVEEAFLKANPDFSADMITVTCRDSHIQEVRVCLTRDLEPRRCGADTRRDCRMSNALFAPIR